MYSISKSTAKLKRNQEKEYPEYLIESFYSKNEVLAGYYTQIPPLVFAEQELFMNQDTIKGVIADIGFETVSIDSIVDYYNHKNFYIYYQKYFNNYISSATIKTLNWLIIDIDNMFYLELDMLCRLSINRLSFKPNYIINTGLGIHLLYKIQPFECYKKYIDFLNNVNKSIQIKYVKTEIKPKDPNKKPIPVKYKVDFQPLTHPYRCPGSLTKLNTQSTIYKIHSENYNILDIANWLGVEAPKIKSPTNLPKLSKQEKIINKNNKKILSYPTSKIGYYKWFLKHHENQFSNRENFMFCLSAIAYKCRVKKEQLISDIHYLVEYFNRRDKLKIKQNEIKKALGGYSHKYMHITWEKISHLTGIKTIGAKRNGLPQAKHLELCNQKRKAIAENKKQKAIKMYIEQGYKKVDIARIMKLSKTTISNYLKDIKPIKTQKTYKYRIIHENILTLHNQGLKPKDIAKQLNISLATVYNHLKEKV